MGGNSGGSLSLSDLNELELKAKKILSEGEHKKHIFISFYHEDIDEVNLLRGQAKNESSELEFDDYSVKEPFDSENAEYIKRKIREKIRHASTTIVYLTDKAASSEWVNWEIEESIRQEKKVIGVYKGENAPYRLPNSFVENKCKCVRWRHADLMREIEN